MNEKISRLMDGDLETHEVDDVCAGLTRPEALSTWTCYHVIGESLRGSAVVGIRVSARVAARLAAEPTVLAPRPRASATPATWAFAAAATVAAVSVVGWTAMSLVGEPPAAMAKARETTVASAVRGRPSNVPADYLLAHQEYSPAMAIQGMGPYLRAVGTQAADAPDDRP